jgi:hypothetical protein
MAMKRNREPWGTLYGPQVLALYLIGLAAIYVGERLIGGRGLGRWLVSGAGALLVLLAVALWTRAAARARDDARRAEKRSLWLSLGGLLALVLYFIGSDVVLGPKPLASADQGVGLREVLGVLWPTLLFCCLLPLVFTHLSAASMGKGQGVEVRRLDWSMISAATIAMLLCTLFFLNAAASRWDKQVDLSYFKTTSPSAASREMISGLRQDTQALLFYPPSNDVLVEVENYFRALKDLSPRFSYRVVDRAADPDLAQKHRVASDGVIVLERGEASERISTGDTLDQARRTLRKLDEEFQKSMLRLTRRRETVYMVVGHGERPAEYLADETRPRVSLLKRFLEALNLQVKFIGPVEGLTREVPADAGLLLWIDPAGQLIAGEAEAIKRYLEQGGRLLLALDVDHRGAASELLDWLGLKYQPVRLGHEKAFVVADNAPGDVYNIITSSFSAHPSVTTVSRASRYFPVLFGSSGYLERKDNASKDKTVIFTVRSLPETWADLDGDGRPGKNEPSRIFELAAAVSWKVKPAEAEKPAESREPPAESATGKEKQSQASEGGGNKAGNGAARATEKDQGREEQKPAPAKGQSESRVVVLADADMLADRFITFRLGYTEVGGNIQLLADILRWLLDEEAVPGVASSEEDIKIVHTRRQDVVWFYGMVFGIPALILMVGAATRWGRGRKRSVA